MIAEQAGILRITYEAFSKFSNRLNSCRAFEDLENCFSIHLKYFFNYHVFRASYMHDGMYVHLQSEGRSTVIQVLKQPAYLPFELRFLKSQVPLRLTDAADIQNGEDNTSPYHVAEPELWGWNFESESGSMVVTVLGSPVKKFTEKDIVFLKLLSESLKSKLLELCLMKELNAKNNEILSINRLQQQIIKERTKEVEDKNKTLLEISILNAHTVREPLSRILGLVSLVSDDQQDDFAMLKELLPMIRQSANDLDNALQSVINKTTKDLTELKA